MLKTFTVKNGLLAKRIYLLPAWTDPLVYDGSSGCGMGREGGMDWMELAQDRDNWQVVVSAVMNLRVP